MQLAGPMHSKQIIIFTFYSSSIFYKPDFSSMSCDMNLMNKKDELKMQHFTLNLYHNDYNVKLCIILQSSMTMQIQTDF